MCTKKLNRFIFRAGCNSRPAVIARDLLTLLAAESGGIPDADSIVWYKEDFR